MPQIPANRLKAMRAYHMDYASLEFCAFRIFNLIKREFPAPGSSAEVMAFIAAMGLQANDELTEHWLDVMEEWRRYIAEVEAAHKNMEKN